MSQQSLKGSCLCGGVTYSVTGEPQRFYHCHCGRCRKATGSGHATNVFVAGELKWDSGEDLITSYKVPEAARFTNRFCSVCGARLPRFIKDLGAVFIPAGSLDTEPGMQPQARIYMGSRTSWSCTGEQLPEFDAQAT
jgi:hypothetical protein